jgi:hypothetical protein
MAVRMTAAGCATIISAAHFLPHLCRERVRFGTERNAGFRAIFSDRSNAGRKRK